MYSSHLCPVSPPQVWERPVALEAELALTLKVLETVANSTLGDILEQPLSMLRHILAKLQACVSDGGARPCVWALSHERTCPSVPGPASHTTLLCPQVPAQPTPGPRPQGHLRHWLHRIQEAETKVHCWEEETHVWGQLGAQSLESLSCPFLPTGVPRLPRSLCHVQPLPPPHLGPELCRQWRPVCLTPEAHLQPVPAP